MIFPEKLLLVTDQAVVVYTILLLGFREPLSPFVRINMVLKFY